MVQLTTFASNHKTTLIWSTIVLLFLSVICWGIWQYGWGWTGFFAFTTFNTSSAAGTIQTHPGKTLWDWMELAIIPVILATGVALFNRAEALREVKRAEQREKEAADRQKEAALQTYLERMTELLLKENLRNSKPEDEVRSVARTLTLTTLRRLDGPRKGLLLRFLQETGLITGGQKAIIPLHGAYLVGATRASYPTGADLSEAELNFSYLVRIDLRKVNLHTANLSGSYLNGAFLSSANLSGANLSDSNLLGANLDHSDLTNANLRNTRLTGAYLRNTDLSGADLRGANLSRAKLSTANLLAAKYDKNTGWPEEFEPENTGAIFIE